MKSIVVLFTTVSLFALTGCELLQALSLLQGEVGCPGAEENQGTMTATVDGEPFEACITVAANDGAFSVTGQDYPDGLVPVQLQVTVTEAAVGTFTLGDEPGNQGRYTPSVDETFVTAPDTASGTVEITTFDDASAAGTFSFTAISGSDGEATAEIEDGAFDVTFE